MCDWSFSVSYIRFFRRLHAFSPFSLSAAVSDWTLWRRNTLSFKSFFAILTTEEREMPSLVACLAALHLRGFMCLAISRGLLLVPGCPSWLQINSSTNLMFEAVLTERRRPLPRCRTNQFFVRDHTAYVVSTVSLETQRSFCQQSNPFQFLEFVSTNDPQQSKMPRLHEVTSQLPAI